MTINVYQLRKYIIEPVLEEFDMHSEAATRLLLMTAAHESHLGRWIVQRKAGPACGIFQIEPSTAQDILGRYLAIRSDIANKLEKRFRYKNITVLGQKENVEELKYLLIGNLHFQTVVARLKYWMSPQPLPNAKNIEALAKYYKEIYNTIAGKAAVETVIYDYEKFVINGN